MLRVCQDIKLDFKDVLIKPCRSELKSRSEVDLITELVFPHSKKTISCVPLVASNMDSIGTFDMLKALSQHRIITSVHKYYSPNDWLKFIETNSNCLNYATASCGITDDDLIKLNHILDVAPGINMVTADVANGYQTQFIDTVRHLRESHPELTIIAGNVVTPELVLDLYEAGADVVKVGLGPGSVCTTRLQTGVGYPQFSAVIECVQECSTSGVKIMSDGGCTCPGDVAKAIAAGADLVMLGGMLSGHEQCSGEVKQKDDGSLVKTFYGMASTTAMIKHTGNVPSYRCAEGKTVEVPFKGDVNAKRKSAVEVLKATKSLYVKTPKNVDDKKNIIKKDNQKKEKKNQHQPDELQSKLRKLLDDSSKENISDWSCFEGLNFKFYTDCDVQYQSLPDLSISSKESTTCTINQNEPSDGSDKMTISSQSQSIERSSSISSLSSKSYGRPPSQPASSLISACGSFNKIEEKLSSWTQPKHKHILRSKSLSFISKEIKNDDDITINGISKDLNDFFEHLGLTTEEYRALTNNDSRSSSPIFFSSRSSQGSGRSWKIKTIECPDDEISPSDPLSVVQTNARVVKWLCRLSHS